MKRRCKSILALLLSVMLAFTLVPMGVWAEDTSQTAPVQIVIENGQSGSTRYKIDGGDWIDLSATTEINNLIGNETIYIQAKPKPDQALDMNKTEFQVDDLKVGINAEVLQSDDGWSFTYEKGSNYRVCVGYLGENGDSQTAPVQIEIRNIQNGSTSYKINDNNWIELSGDENIDDITDGAIVYIRAMPNPDQALDTTGTRFWVEGEQGTIDTDKLQTDAGWSFTYEDGKKYQVCVEYKGENGGPGPEPGEPAHGGYTGDKVTADITITGDADFYINDSRMVNSGENAPKQVDYTYDSTSKTVDFYINWFINKRYTSFMINEKEYVDLLPTPDNPEALLAACKGQTNEFQITVPYADSYEIVAAQEATDNMVVGNFLWTYLEEHNQGDDYIDHGRVTLLEADYSKVEVENYDPASYPNLGWSQNEDGGDAVLPVGTVVTVELVPDYGYQLTSFGINGGEFKIGEKQSTFTFEIKPGNFHLGAHFTEVKDEVITTAETVKDGTIALGDSELSSGSAQLKISDASADKRTEFETKAPDGYTVTDCMNIDLYNVFYKGKVDAKDVWANKVDTLKADATIQMQLDSSLLKGVTDPADIKILHDTGNVYEQIAVESYDANTNTVTFKTSSFSPYAIAVKQSEDPNPDDPDPKPQKIKVYLPWEFEIDREDAVVEKDSDGREYYLLDASDTMLTFHIEGFPGQIKDINVYFVVGDRHYGIDQDLKASTSNRLVYNALLSGVSEGQYTYEISFDGMRPEIYLPVQMYVYSGDPYQIENNASQFELILKDGYKLIEGEQLELGSDNGTVKCEPSVNSFGETVYSCTLMGVDTTEEVHLTVAKGATVPRLVNIESDKGLEINAPLRGYEEAWEDGQLIGWNVPDGGDFIFDVCHTANISEEEYTFTIISQEKAAQNYTISLYRRNRYMDTNTEYAVESYRISGITGNITIRASLAASKFGEWQTNDKEHWHTRGIIEERGEHHYGDDDSCLDCGYNPNSGGGIIIPPHSHTYGSWTKADDTNHQRVCSCGDVITEAHKWDAGKVTTEPTHTKEGVKTYTCTVCGATKTEKVDKLADHSYGEWTKADETNHQRVCACGEKETEAHTFSGNTCTKCGYTKSDSKEDFVINKGEVTSTTGKTDEGKSTVYDVPATQESVHITGPAAKEIAKSNTDTVINLNQTEGSAIKVTIPAESKLSTNFDIKVTAKTDELENEQKAAVLTVEVGKKDALPAPMKFTAKVTEMTDAKAGDKVYVYTRDENGKLVEVANNVKTVSKAGNVTIPATNNGEYVILTEKAEDVVKLVDTVSSKLSAKTVEKGKSVTLTPVLPNNIAKVTSFTKGSDPVGQEEAIVTYKSSDTSIATVSKYGNITGKKAGTVKITMTIRLENGQKKTITKTITIK